MPLLGMIAQGPPVDPDTLSPVFLLFPVFTILPVVILFLWFCRAAVETRQKMFAYVAFLFATSLASHLFSIMSNFAPEQAAAEALYVVSTVVGMVALYDLILVLEMFEENKAFSWTQMGFTVLLALVVGSILTEPGVVSTELENGYLVTTEHGTALATFQLLFALAAAVRVGAFFVRSRKATRDPKQRHLVTWLFVGILLSQMVGSLLPVALRPTREVGYSVASFGTIFNTIGLVIVGIAFLRVGKEPWLLQRQRAHFLLVYSREGLALYAKTFHEAIDANDMTLLTGGFSAVTSMFQETTKVVEPLEAILFRGRELRVIARERFLCALMVDYTTQASEKAHERFVQEFERRFHEALEAFDGNVNKFRAADEIAAKYFA